MAVHILPCLAVDCKLCQIDHSLTGKTTCKFLHPCFHFLITSFLHFLFLLLGQPLNNVIFFILKHRISRFRTFLDIVLCTVCTLTHHHHSVQLENLQKDIKVLALPSKFHFSWSSLPSVSDAFKVMLCSTHFFASLHTLASSHLPVHFCFLLKPRIGDMAHALSLLRWQLFAC